MQGTSSQPRPTNPPGFQPINQGMAPQAERKPDWEIAMEKMVSTTNDRFEKLISATNDRFEKIEGKVDQLAASSKNMEDTLGKSQKQSTHGDRVTYPARLK